ncbi:ester hydrolase C11orf54 homolog [Uranotaenia lowii]|uniref:ester hydrolase C11orf54 homolog n=1 Tax=Uranotaenia lowii TaxID=190385 RepID=UPI002479083C|nr:ester hydrolase C11orf54 homolog [Uranotaenia lowii]
MHMITTKFKKKQFVSQIFSVVSSGMKSNFATVEVEVVDCPNLTEGPFHLAGRGLGGSPTLVELGGPPYLLPTVDYTKLYDLVEVCQKAINSTKKEFVAIGAGAGPYPLVDSNCEGMYNLRVGANGHVVSESHLAQITPDRKKALLKKIPSSETRCALLGNIFVSEGAPGKVLRVHCKKRTGDLDFIASIRTTLERFYGERTVGLGGVFLLKQGKARQHVMSPFSETPLNSEHELNEWLNFFNMSAPLIAVGTLVTNEYDLDLRLQHFHSFSKHGEGGHYHIDTTPDIVEYEGYFNVGEKIVRVDKPLITHKYGRD